MSAGENIEITNAHKRIYNQYLRTTRTAQGKPFKYRKQFDNFGLENILICKQIAAKLNQYPFINFEDYFYAPFFADSNQLIKFKFYATSQAITAYTKYMLYLEQLPPDEIESLQRTRDSLVFIRDFCQTNNINISEYFNFKIEQQYACILHLKERKIWIYALIEFPQFDRVIISCDKDIIKLMCGSNFFDKIEAARVKYFKSIKCKTLVKTIITKLKLT